MIENQKRYIYILLLSKPMTYCRGRVAIASISAGLLIFSDVISIASKKVQSINKNIILYIIINNNICSDK